MLIIEKPTKTTETKSYKLFTNIFHLKCLHFMATIRSAFIPGIYHIYSDFLSSSRTPTYGYGYATRTRLPEPVYLNLSIIYVGQGLCKNKVVHRQVCVMFWPNPPIAILELPNCLSYGWLASLKGCLYSE